MHRRALLSTCGTLILAGCLGSRTESRGTTDDQTKSTTDHSTTTANRTANTTDVTDTADTTETTDSICAPRGPVEPTDDVLGVRGCDADSVSVTLKFGVNEACHDDLLLNTDRGTGDAVELSDADLTGLSELQNAVAYLGSDTTSVQVQTSKRRDIIDYLESLADTYDSTTRFEYSGRSFTLTMGGEQCVLTTETTEN